MDSEINLVLVEDEFVVETEGFMSVVVAGSSDCHSDGGKTWICGPNFQNSPVKG